MLDFLFDSILETGATGAPAAASVLGCLLCSLALGALIALLYGWRSTHSKSFAVTLALLPAIVQMVILLVNGNLGAGVAVMGAFSLVRFRSAPGSAREICSIFLAMAVGLATGMGYLGIAALFTLVIGGVSLLYTASPFGEPKRLDKVLKITIPEGLEYEGLFDDLFRKYTSRWELAEVRTTNMGSLFRLTYRLTLRDAGRQKAFLDELRERNGNLELSCGRPAFGGEEL